MTILPKLNTWYVGYDRPWEETRKAGTSDEGTVQWLRSWFEGIDASHALIDELKAMTRDQYD